MGSIMTNTTFTFDNFVSKAPLMLDGENYNVGNTRIYISERQMSEICFIGYLSVRTEDEIQKDFLLKNGFASKTNPALCSFYAETKEELEKAKEIALKSIFAGVLTLESGISFSKEARAEFAKHPKFIMRKHNGGMRFYDAVTKVAFWQTTPIKESGKCQNGYIWFITESGHKYQITTINQ